MVSAARVMAGAARVMMSAGQDWVQRLPFQWSISEPRPGPTAQASGPLDGLVTI